MIFETFVAYLIIIAPTLVSVLCGMVVDYLRKRNMDKAAAAIQVAEDKFNEFTNSNEVKQLVCQNATLINHLDELSKANILLTEEITRIHKLHPEWFTDDDKAGE